MSERGLGEESLGKAVGVSSVAVHNWKNYSRPRPAALKRLADFFGCDVEWLRTGAGEGPVSVKVPAGMVGFANARRDEQWARWAKALRGEYRKHPVEVEAGLYRAFPKAAAAEILAWLNEQ
jgi:hypothetical protein